MSDSERYVYHPYVVVSKNDEGRRVATFDFFDSFSHAITEEGIRYDGNDEVDGLLTKWIVDKSGDEAGRVLGEVGTFGFVVDLEGGE